MSIRLRGALANAPTIGGKGNSRTVSSARTGSHQLRNLQSAHPTKGTIGRDRECRLLTWRGDIDPQWTTGKTMDRREVGINRLWDRLERSRPDFLLLGEPFAGGAQGFGDFLA